MPYARVNGIRLFYKDVGAGPPLVLVPGFGADSTAYNPLLSALRGRIRAIAPDPRGLGRSDDFSDPISTHLLAHDLLALLDHLEVDSASFLGCSMGALVVRRLAAIRPERVDRMVLCAAGQNESPYYRRVLALLRILVEEAPLEDLMRHLFTLILAPAFIDKRDGWVQEMELLTRPDERTRNTMRRQLEMLETEVGHEMGDFPAPVLVLVGSQDRLVPFHHAEALAKAYPRGRLEILEGVGHHPFLEATQEAVEAVLAFLDQ